MKRQCPIIILTILVAISSLANVYLFLKLQNIQLDQENQKITNIFNNQQQIDTKVNKVDNNDNNKFTDKTIYALYPGEKGDKSFIDSFASGVNKAQTDFKFKLIEKNLLNIDELNDCFLSGNCKDGKPNGVLVLSEVNKEHVKKWIDKNSDINFMILDTNEAYTGQALTLKITTFKTSKLAGQLAAKVTQTNKVGIIMGQNVDFLNEFQNGFLSGVKLSQKDILTYVQFVGTGNDGFKNPQKGEQLANKLFDKGVDVIYSAAGESGIGVINAANNREGKYVIGTDSDQSTLGPNSVLASVMKRMDLAGYDTIKKYLLGDYQKANFKYDLESGFTQLLYNKNFEHFK